MKNKGLSFFPDYEREPVPYAERHGWFRLGMVWIGIAINLSAVLLGSQIGSGLMLKDAFVATLAGSFLVAIIAALCAYVGAATGQSTAMISRYAFGEYGSRLIAIVIGLSLFGWFGVQAGFFGISAQVVVEKVFGLQVSTNTLSLIGGLLMTSTAVIGYRAIEKLSLWAVPLMVLLLVSGLYFALGQQPIVQALQTPPSGPPLSMGFAISLVSGGFLVGCVISPDISRYARTRKDAVWSTMFGFFFGNTFMIMIAAFLSKVTGISDINQIFLSLGMGLPAVLVLILAQWTTNDNNLYSSALGFSIVFQKIPKHILAIIGGLIGTLLAVIGIYEHFIGFLTVLTAFIVPVGGIYVAEYFLLDASRFQFNFVREQKIPVFIWRSIVVWTLATLFTFATSPADNPVGLSLFTFTTIPSLDGFLAAVLLQYLFGKGMSMFGKKTDLSQPKNA